MTVINRTHGFIFIHIPKTGGTSIKEQLREYGHEADIYIDRPADAAALVGINERKIRKHSSAVQVHQALGSAEFDRLFKFCFVRNPFIRTMSLFRFLRFNFRSWPRSEMMESLDTLEKFVGSPIFRGTGPGGIASSQVHWLADKTGAIRVNFIARVERLDADFREIRTRLALPCSGKPLRRANESKGATDPLIAELVSGTVVDAIRTRYASDFQLLGYSTDPEEALDHEDGRIPN
jgi:hypothetical protein